MPSRPAVQKPRIKHVDRLAAAARDEDLALLDAVVLGQLRRERGRARRRIDVQPALRGVAGRPPRRLVRVEANAAGLVGARDIRTDARSSGRARSSTLIAGSPGADGREPLVDGPRVRVEALETSRAWPRPGRSTRRPST